MLNNKKLFERRKRRTRHRLRKVERIKPRLSVFRSSKHIYAQVIDDLKGKTVAAAAQVGKLVAERAKSAGVETVVFDRGGYLYHGRVKALGDAAREAGLKF